MKFLPDCDRQLLRIPKRHAHELLPTKVFALSRLLFGKSRTSLSLLFPFQLCLRHMLHQCQHNNWVRDTCMHPFVVITLFSFASFRPSTCILDFFRSIKC